MSGSACRARRCRNRQRTQLAGSNQSDRRSKGIENDIDPAANQVGHRRRRAAIGHPYHVYAGHHLEQFAVDIDACCRCPADAMLILPGLALA